ncbi:MAG: hypothetical protein AAFV30_00210, partial [Pseudomonadota bacterium]
SGTIFVVNWSAGGSICDAGASRAWKKPEMRLMPHARKSSAKGSDQFSRNKKACPQEALGSVRGVITLLQEARDRMEAD